MNINRDYLIINDVKKSNVKLDNGSIFFYITDKNTQNIFVNLVINISNNDLIQKYANIENAEDYTLTMNIVKPSNTYKIVEGKLHDKEKAIFEFNLNEDCCDEIGTYRCELLTKCNINAREEVTTSNKLTYKVKSSVLNDLDNIVEAPEYPLVIQLFDKLSDIEQYEENRRANELARQLAEEQRQTRFDELNADIDNKMVDVENRISAKEEAVDTLIVDTKADIDEYKVAKDQEIDDYKTAKDTEINEAITNQNTAINVQNDKISAVENNVVAQNSKLDILETKTTTHEARITAVEAKNTEQDSRLDVAENRLANIGNDITNTMQPIIDEHTSRLDAIEAIDVSQNARLDVIEAKNQQQDDRLLDIEKVNNRQNIDIKCLYSTVQTIDVTKEGNSIYLQNSNNGFTIVDEIQGNTLVNCNKEPNKELILNGNINASGDDTVTITEGVDGGLVDVALEGNTLVNVSNTKDSTAITKAYTVENSGNHIALQGEYDGKCRPVVTGNTLVNLIDRFNDSISPQGAYTATNKGFTLTKNHDGGITYFRYKLKYPLDKSKKYTIIYDILENTLVNTDANFGIYTDGVYGATGSATTTGGSADGKLGRIISVHDVKASDENLDRLSLGVHQGDVGGKVVVDNLMLLEGDYTNKPIPDYFTGLQSTFEGNLVTQEMVDNGEEEVGNLGKYRADYSVTGKNKAGQLLNYDTIGGSVYTTNLKLDNTGNIKGYLFKVQPNTKYAIAKDREDKRFRVFFFKENPILDSTQLSIGGSYADNYKIIITTSPSNAKYGYLVATNNYSSSPFSWCQIEEGNTATSYEPYKEGTKTLYLNSPLLEGDTIEEKDGGIYHVHRSELVAYTEGDETSLITDKVNTLHGLETPTYELIEQSNLAIPSYANGHLDFNTAVPVEKVDFLPFSEELTYLYANTQYTVQFIATETIAADITLGGTQLLAQSIIAGLNRISITTPSELVDNKLIISGVGTNIMEVIVTDIDRELMYFEGMKSVGEGKELQVISINSERRLVNTQQLTHEPLRGTRDAKDRYVLIDGKWYIERKCGIRAYQEGDEDNYKTDLVNTVYPLEMPTYEEIDYNPLEVYSGTTNITTNSVIPTNITVKNHGFNCLLKPSTTYTISSNLGLNTVTTPSTLTEDCLRFMDTDTSDVTTMRDVLVLEGDWTTKADLIPANFSGIESAFEQEYDVEKSKYKVNVKVANEDKTKENNITFYINEPLRGTDTAKDRVFIKDNKVVVERNCGIRPYEDGDFGTYLTDKVNTVYPLAEPTYEEVEYNDTKLFIESFKNSTLFYNSNVPVTSTVHYSYSVPIIDTVAQTANVTDQQDSMIIDLATQVAVMEMMLM